jgi:hypothetical protein
VFIRQPKTYRPHRNSSGRPQERIRLLPNGKSWLRWEREGHARGDRRSGCRSVSSAAVMDGGSSQLEPGEARYANPATQLDTRNAT